MRTPSLWAIVVLVVVVLLLFGARRLPDVASSVGKSLKIFKKEVKELSEDEPAPRPVPVDPSVAYVPPAQPAAARDEHLRT
ncbi:twin-arginine translocase TatA/TatE family subunit [Oceanitalea stevensii]|uniref:Sec-independent protein translocase protein TatA n=1 Tax=Oceanitalea stevensii TaxID=2763072 RepID=A0ABR8Z544_9MICO|nr:twin-arginine translocase TatA/TatE family subunit [Oceanitalea stevensii]MBD8063441.1 twin-arginine translocase TatA/TatE family subunit [Oceanitalea stevensii]